MKLNRTIRYDMTSDPHPLAIKIATTILFTQVELAVSTRDVIFLLLMLVLAAGKHFTTNEDVP